MLSLVLVVVAVVAVAIELLLDMLFKYIYCSVKVRLFFAEE